MRHFVSINAQEKRGRSLFHLEQCGEKISGTDNAIACVAGFVLTRVVSPFDSIGSVTNDHLAIGLALNFSNDAVAAVA